LQIRSEPFKGRGGISRQRALPSGSVGLALFVEDALTNLTSPRRPARLARQLALAAALASGTALLSVPGFADAALAQKKKDDKQQQAAKPVYSPEFVKAYAPVETALKAPGVDAAALKPQILAILPLAKSPDEMLAIGVMMFNAGIVAKDQAFQLQGVEQMLASGKAPPAEAARYSLVASQLSAAQKQYDKARTYLQKAIDLGYSDANIKVADLQLSMAEYYFAEERNLDGLKYLAEAIAGRKAQGAAVDERWYKRGVSIAYNNQILPQVYDFVQGWVSDYPTETNWRDAVNLTRNLNEYDAPIMLDLFRLGDKVGSLNAKNDYLAYIEAADTRRLPAEVKRVIEEGYRRGVVPQGSDSWIEEQYKLANSLIVQDKTALPTLERDANAPAASLRTVMAAGDTMLAYSDYAKAVTFYQKALGMPGADTNLVLTRLGIAQLGAGDAAAAKASFAKIEGPRVPVARLWTALANQPAGAAAPAAAN
jgi:tetratricopeptide (TPR) repeat protein